MATDGRRSRSGEVTETGIPPLAPTWTSAPSEGPNTITSWLLQVPLGATAPVVPGVAQTSTGDPPFSWMIRSLPSAK